jgi:hypothetical protein
MRKSIKISSEGRQELREKFQVSDQMIGYALNYVKNGPAAVRIRQEALRLGGVYVEEHFVPTCRFEQLPDGFRQIFAGDVVLQVDVKKSTAKISRRGEEIESIDEITLDSWAALAMQAQQLSIDGCVLWRA